MRCYKHYEMEAVGYCSECGRTLCPECLNTFQRPLCEPCALASIKADKSEVTKRIVIGGIFFAVGLFYLVAFARMDFAMSLFLFALHAGFPWGWYALDSLTPNGFLFLSCLGWLIYFGIKIQIAVIIGIFAAPFQIVKLIRRKKEITESLDYLDYSMIQ